MIDAVLANACILPAISMSEPREFLRAPSAATSWPTTARATGSKTGQDSSQQSKHRHHEPAGHRHVRSYTDRHVRSSTDTAAEPFALLIMTACIHTDIRHYRILHLRQWRAKLLTSTQSDRRAAFHKSFAQRNPMFMAKESGVFEDRAAVRYRLQ